MRSIFPVGSLSKTGHQNSHVCLTVCENKLFLILLLTPCYPTSALTYWDSLKVIKFQHPHHMCLHFTCVCARVFQTTLQQTGFTPARRERNDARTLNIRL